METEKTTSLDLTNKKQDIMSFFGSDSAFVFVQKKTEKLASAIYMITNLFNDSEPMKWTLREKISDLLSFIILYKDIPQSGISDFANRVRTKVLELTSMLEVASAGSMISPMNFSILKQEFMNLVSVFDDVNNSQKDMSYGIIPETFFNESGSYKKVSSNSDGVVFHRAVDAEMSLKNVKDNLSHDRDVLRRSNRQNIIIGLLKKKKELTIKDISLVIKDCSEKTIQRELISLISSGVLLRTGERRWSRYSLVV